MSKALVFLCLLAIFATAFAEDITCSKLPELEKSIQADSDNFAAKQKEAAAAAAAAQAVVAEKQKGLEKWGTVDLKLLTEDIAYYKAEVIYHQQRLDNSKSASASTIARITRSLNEAKQSLSELEDEYTQYLTLKKEKEDAQVIVTTQSNLATYFKNRYDNAQATLATIQKQVVACKEQCAKAIEDLKAAVAKAGAAADAANAQIEALKAKQSQANAAESANLNAISAKANEQANKAAEVAAEKTKADAAATAIGNQLALIEMIYNKTSELQDDNSRTTLRTILEELAARLRAMKPFATWATLSGQLTTLTQELNHLRTQDKEIKATIAGLAAEVAGATRVYTDNIKTRDAAASELREKEGECGSVLTHVSGPRSNAVSVQSQANIVFFDKLDTIKNWRGKNGAAVPYSGYAVADPKGSGSNVLSFRQCTGGGDAFSASTVTSKSGKIRVSFDYMGTDPNNSGGFFGVSCGFPGNHYWLVATQSYPGAVVVMKDNGVWTNYSVDVDLNRLNCGDNVANGKIVRPAEVHLMFEDWSGSGGACGNVYFDNIAVQTL